MPKENTPKKAKPTPQKVTRGSVFRANRNTTPIIPDEAFARMMETEARKNRMLENENEEDQNTPGTSSATSKRKSVVPDSFGASSKRKPFVPIEEKVPEPVDDSNDGVSSESSHSDVLPIGLRLDDFMEHSEADRIREDTVAQILEQVNQQLSVNNLQFQFTYNSTSRRVTIGDNYIETLSSLSLSIRNRGQSSGPSTSQQTTEPTTAPNYRDIVQKEEPPKAPKEENLADLELNLVPGPKCKPVVLYLPRFDMNDPIFNDNISHRSRILYLLKKIPNAVKYAFSHQLDKSSYKIIF